MQLSDVCDHPARISSLYEEHRTGIRRHCAQDAKGQRHSSKVLDALAAQVRELTQELAAHTTAAIVMFDALHRWVYFLVATDSGSLLNSHGL
jgi:hypothetical protein